VIDRHAEAAAKVGERTIHKGEKQQATGTKDSWRVATRYDKLARNFLAATLMLGCDRRKFSILWRWRWKRLGQWAFLVVLLRLGMPAKRLRL
jgi:hypothetical protein